MNLDDNHVHVLLTYDRVCIHCQNERLTYDTVNYVLNLSASPQMLWKIFNNKTPTNIFSLVLFQFTRFKSSDNYIMDTGEDEQTLQAAIAELDAQLSVLDSRIEKSERERDLLRTENGEAKSRLTSVEMERRAIEEEFKDVLSMNKEDEDMLAQIQELVIVNEALKKDEAEFKAACRKEHQEMMARNEELQRKVDSQGKDEENEVTEEDVERAKARLAAVRLELASKTREADALERKLDDVPSSYELAQYQKRFLELDNQMAAEFSQTQQFYTLYNALEAQRVQVVRENSMLNSILEGLPVGKTGQAQKEHFLRQLEELVKEVRQALEKTKADLKSEEVEKARLSHELGELHDVHRKYTLLVRDMREELKRNEQLTLKLKK